MTLIKICGITSWADAAAAVDSGADMLGFHCDQNSARLISPEAFAAIAARLPEHVGRVAVFDRAADERWKTAGRAMLGLFTQIQYYQDSVWTEVVRENWDMGRKIKAFHVAGEADLRRIANFSGTVQSFLLNVHSTGSRGFSSADAYGWEMAREVHQFGKRLLLAGGLTPATVESAVARVMPYAVDVVAGVESLPGVKDAQKMRAFVRAVRASDGAKR